MRRRRGGSAAAAGGLGARAVQLPARWGPGFRSRRGRGAQPHRGPPRLARLDGRLLRREGACVRPDDHDGDQPRRPGRRATRAACRVAAKRRAPKPLVRRVLRFGVGEPNLPGDFGIRTENGMAWLVRAMESDETIKRGKDEAPEDLFIQRLMPADALRVRGRHNASNALAALALATAIGCPLAPMLHALRDYTGEPHRVEQVATVDGVDAFDDSKGHQRRRHRRRPRRPRCGQGAVEARGDPRGRRHRARISRRCARASGAPRSGGGHDRPRCATHRGGAGRSGAADAASRHPRRRGALVFRAGPRGRCRAAQPGLRQLRHVPPLRAPRRGVRRQRAGARRRAREGSSHERRHGPSRWERLARSPGRTAFAQAQAAGRRGSVHPGARLDPCRQRPAAASARLRPGPAVGGGGPARAGPGDGLQRLGRAARQPEIRAVRQHAFPDASRPADRHRRGGGAGWWCRSRSACGRRRHPGCSSSPWCCWCWCCCPSSARWSTTRGAGFRWAY